MTLDEIKSYYVNGNRFSLLTGMSANTFRHWFRLGYIPMYTQKKIETFSNGRLIADCNKK